MDAQGVAARLGGARVGSRVWLHMFFVANFTFAGRMAGALWWACACARWRPSLLVLLSPCNHTPAHARNSYSLDHMLGPSMMTEAQGTEIHVFLARHSPSTQQTHS